MANDTTVKPIQGTSPIGIAIYPKLNSPDTKFNPDGVYSVTLKVGEDDSQKLLDAIEKMVLAQEAEVRAELKSDFDSAKDGKAKASAKKKMEALTVNYPYANSVDDNGDDTSDIEFKFKSNATYKDKKTGEIKPRSITMFDAANNALKPCPNVWGGSLLRVAFNMSPYYVSGTGMVGVSLQINAVKVLKLVTGGSGQDASAYGFEEEEGYTDDPESSLESTKDANAASKEEATSDDF